MGTCCSQDCCPTKSMRNAWANGAVPGAYLAGYKYNDTDPNEPCCKCAFTDALCKSIDSKYPHAKGECGPCQCDPNKVLIRRKGLDSCLKFTGAEGLYCPVDKPTWVAEKCECECQVDPASCPTGQVFKPEFCRCVCEKELIKCDGGDPCDSAPFLDNPTPNYHPEDCSCKCDLDPANGGPGCTEPGAPDFNADKCECWCAKTKTGIVDMVDCPSDKPYLDTTICECYCPEDAVKRSCKSDEVFDPDSCSCKPCQIPCKGSNVRVKGSCDCECPKDQSGGVDCPPDQPYLDTIECECYCPSSVAESCSGSETFDPETCSCVYNPPSTLSLFLRP